MGQLFRLRSERSSNPYQTGVWKHSSGRFLGANPTDNVMHRFSWVKIARNRHL